MYACTQAGQLCYSELTKLLFCGKLFTRRVIRFTLTRSYTGVVCQTNLQRQDRR